MAIDRRGFLKSMGLATAAVAGGGLLTACSGGHDADTAAAASSISWDDEADVVIVGAGGGGNAAAVEASAAGASVLVLERLSHAGFSNSALNAGMVMAGGSSVQAGQGITDTTDNFDTYLANCFEGYESEELRKVLSGTACETIDWIQDELGVPMAVMEEFPGMGITPVFYYADKAMPASRVHVPQAGSSGSHITSAMISKAEAAGARYLYDTPATQLLTNDAGEVIGVVAEQGSKTINIKANKGVILSSGGFMRNKEMIDTFMTIRRPECDVRISVTSGNPWQQGDGIRMGQAVGAKLATMWSVYYPSLAILIDRDDNLADFTYIGKMSPGFYATAEGELYQPDFSTPNELQVWNIWNLPGGFCWAIWDQNLVDAGAVGMGSFSSDMSTEVANGSVFKGNSITELAEAIGADPAKLQAAMEAHNAANDDAMAVTTAPFYAGRVVEASPDSGGGLAINAKAQVLNHDDQPISRLYACGAVSGGWKGKVAAGCGYAYANALVFGRIAGKQAAALSAVE